MAVTLHTTAGDMKIELFCQSCPKTCEVKIYIQSLIFFIHKTLKKFFFEERNKFK